MRNFGNPNDESWRSTWTGWVTDPFWDDGGADAGVVGGTITTPEGTASAADVYDYQQGNSPGTTSPYKPVPDDEPAKPKVPVIAYALIAGVLGLGAYTLYKRQQEA